MAKLVKIISFLFGSFLLFFLIKRVGFYEVTGIIDSVRWPWVLAGVFVYAALILMRSCKWFILAKVIKSDIRYWRFLPFYLVNSLMGNLTPFKSGEAATPFLFKKHLGIDLGRGFFVVILDRFFELMAFGLILIISVVYLLYKGIGSGFILSVFWTMMIILLLALIFLIAALLSKKFVFKIFGFFRILKFLEKELAGFYDAWSFFKGKKVYRSLFLLTAACWIFEILSYWLIFNSVFPIFWADAMAAQMIAAAATLLSFIPGGVGVGEVGVVYVLNLLKYSTILTTGGVIMARIFLTGTLLIAGLGGLVVLKHNVAKAKENFLNHFSDH